MKQIIDADDLTKELTMVVEVKIINVWRVRFRLFIALQLVKIAAWIGGYGLEINQEIGVLVTDNKIEKL